MYLKMWICVQLIFMIGFSAAVVVLSSDSSNTTDLAADENEPVSISKRDFLTDFRAIPGALLIHHTKTEDIPTVLSKNSPELILAVTKILNETERMRVMTSLNSSQVMNLTQRMTPEQTGQLLSYLPAYGVVGLSRELTREQLGSLLTSLPRDSVVSLTHSLNGSQNYEIIDRLQPTDMLTLLHTLGPSQAMGLLPRLPSGGIINITQLLTPDQLGQLVDMLPPSGVVQLVITFPPAEMSRLVSKLPPASVQNLTMSLFPEQLSLLLSKVPPRAVLDITEDLEPEQLSTVLTSISPESLINLTSSLPKEGLMTILHKVNPESIINATKPLNQQLLSKLVTNIPSEGLGSLLTHLPTEDILDLLKRLPDSTVGVVVSSLGPQYLKPLLNTLPEEVVTNITLSLTPKQISNVLDHLISDNMSDLVSLRSHNTDQKTTAELLDQTIQTFIQTYNSSQLAELLKSFQLAQIGNILMMLPPQTIQSLINSLPSDAVADLVTTLPADITNSVLSRWPSDLIRNVTDTMNATQMADLVRLLTPESVISVVSILPEDEVAKILDEVQVDVLVNLTSALNSSQLQILLAHTPQTAQNALIAKLPGYTIVSLLGKLPPEVVGSLVASLPVHDLLGTLKKLNPEQKSKLIISLNVSNLLVLVERLPPDVPGKLLMSLPTDVLLNLTQSLPAASITAIFNQLQPDDISNLLGKFPERDIAGFIGSLPPNVLTSLPEDVLAKTIETLSAKSLALVLQTLNSSQILSILNRLPNTMVAGLVTKLPTELVANLTTMLPPEKLGEILQSLNSTTMSKLLVGFPPEKLQGLISVLQKEPEALINVTLSLSGEALATLLNTLPDSVVLSLIKSLPQSAINALVPKIPVDLVLNLTKILPSTFILNLPVSVVFGLVVNIPGEKLLQLINSFFPSGIFSLVQLIPQSMLTGIFDSVSSDQIAFLLNAIPPGKLGSMIGDLLPGLINMFTQGGGVGSVDLGQSLGPVLQSLPGILQNLTTSQRGQMFSQLKGILPGLVSSVVAIPTSALQEMAKKNSDQGVKNCLMNLSFYILELFNGSTQAVRMFDASGKPGRGILVGNTHMLSSYDMCIDLGATSCGAGIGVPPDLLPPSPGKGILPDVSVELHLCLPSACKTRELSSILSNVSLPMNITIPWVSCQEDEDLHDDNAAIAAIGVVCVLGCLVLLGTLVSLTRSFSDSDDGYDLYSGGQGEMNGGLQMDERIVEGQSVDVGRGEKQTSFITSNGANPPAVNGVNKNSNASAKDNDSEHDEEDDYYDNDEGSIVSQALLAFSLPINTGRILGVDDVKDSISCLHGVRFLSLCWIMVGHSVYLMGTFFENGLEAALMLEKIVGQVVFQSTLAVDTFFVISGCLAAFKFLREASEYGLKLKNVLKYFFHRLVRLTPSYAIAIMAFTCLVPYMSDGPNWHRHSRAYYHTCTKYWWTNLLYINNFYKSLSEQCVPWGWYLAVDMQFHWLVAPFIIIPLAVGYKVSAFLLISALVVLQAGLTYYYQVDINGDVIRNRSEYWWSVFEKPYTRVAPFVLGLGLGALLSHAKRRVKLPTVGVLVGWVLAIAVVIAAVMVKYDENHVILEDSYHWPHAARAWHDSVYRILFSLAVCWIVAMCASGYGGFINSMLSWKVFVPLSHLTFCMYLLHPAVILADMWQSRASPYFTLSYLIQRVSGYLLLSAIFAFFLSVSVETPIIALERMIFRKRRDRPSPSTSL